MRPIPQTVEAVSELARYDDQDLLASLQGMGERVQRLVPDCLGLSLCWAEDDIAFTLMASEEEIAVLDGLQYLGAGPCTEAVRRAEGVATDHADLMSEETWWIFALASAARGVRSSLTFPLTDHGRTVGSINLYGGSDRAFDGQHQELADALGVWAPGAVRNADLSFATRRRAEQAPGRIREAHEVDVAVGVLAARSGESTEVTLRRIERAALAAGVSVVALARALRDLEA